MAQFRWEQYPHAGGCLACLSQTNDRGFIDLIGETTVLRSQDIPEVVGVVDVIYCASCLEAAAQMIGSGTQQETFNLVQDNYDKDQEIERLKDEIQAHQQRFEQMIDKLAGTDWKESLNAPNDPST